MDIMSFLTAIAGISAIIIATWKISGQIGGLQSQINGLEKQMNAQIGGLQSRINGLETQMNAQIGGLQSQINGMQSQINNLATEVHSINEFLRREK